MSYLFGSIIAVSSDDLIYMSILDIFIISIVVFFYKQILAVSYDSEFASLRGINVKFFYTLILILAALCVVAAIKAVGLILVIALLTIPTYLAESFASRLSSMMILSSILATIFTILGLVVSYSYDISSGASIIMVAVLVLGVVKLLKLKK
jgi:zinc transport system permease protein